MALGKFPVQISLQKPVRGQFGGTGAGPLGAEEEDVCAGEFEEELKKLFAELDWEEPGLGAGAGPVPVREDELLPPKPPEALLPALLVAGGGGGGEDAPTGEEENAQVTALQPEGQQIPF